ncbi:MAG: hypothetical protein WCD79_05245 [Chthoniobacteraceae bacterium]
MPYWSKIVLVLCAIWALAAGVIYFARAAKPTADSIAAYLQKNDLASQADADRQKEIDRVADMLNRTTLEDRQKLRDNGVTNGFFRSLTPEEQSAFLDKTLPTGFKQMMESFNKMTPSKRKDFVDHALTEMRKHEGDQPAKIDDANTKKIVDQGLRSFYSDSSADVKMDLAPLIEQMQRNLQGPR